MTLHPCAREKEIAELLRLGHWPDAASAELREHVSGCHMCGDFVLVTQTFQADREQSSSPRPFQSPGVLWWRAQLRRQNAAVERMNKPILGAQIFALSITALLAVGFVVFQAAHGLRWLSWFADFSQSRASYVEGLRSLTSMASGWGLGLLAPGLAALALLSGVVVYLASDRQ